MTEIERKALALIAEIKAERGLSGPDYLSARAALIRAIEQHEAFKREVSDALDEEWGEEYCLEHRRFSHFIITKPDPLVEALIESLGRTSGQGEADDLRQALAARGLKIVETEQ